MLGVLGQEFAVAGVVVEHLRVGAYIAQQQLLALPMHLDEFFAQLLQVGEAHHGAVHAGASLAVLKNFPANDEFVVAVDLELLEHLLDARLVLNIERPFDNGLLFAGPDHVRLRLVAADHA